MTKTLLTILGIGKGTWGHVKRLIEEGEWEKVIIVSNDWGKENFSIEQNCEWIMANNRVGFDMLKDEIKKGLPEEKDISVCLVSGIGKEHMAMLAALKENGNEIKMVLITKEGIKHY